MISFGCASSSPFHPIVVFSAAIFDKRPSCLHQTIYERQQKATQRFVEGKESKTFAKKFHQQGWTPLCWFSWKRSWKRRFVSCELDSWVWIELSRPKTNKQRRKRFGESTWLWICSGSTRSTLARIHPCDFCSQCCWEVMDGGLTHAVVAELGRVTLVIFWFNVTFLFGRTEIFHVPNGRDESETALRSVLGSMEEATTTTFDPPTSGLVGEEARSMRSNRPSFSPHEFLPDSKTHTTKNTGKWRFPWIWMKILDSEIYSKNSDVLWGWVFVYLSLKGFNFIKNFEIRILRRYGRWK